MVSIKKNKVEFIATTLHTVFLTPHIFHEVTIGELNPNRIISLDGILELMGTLSAMATVIIFFAYRHYEKKQEKSPINLDK